MRWPLLVSVALISACSGFRQIERGDWKLVYADSARRDAEAPREIITRDAYESEVAAGTPRGWVAPAGYTFPLLHETEAIGLQVGEVQGFRIDEGSDADLFVDGGVIELFWGNMEKKDGWNVDTDVTIKESTLYVKARKPGVATLRIIRGPSTRDIPVTVK